MSCECDRKGERVRTHGIEMAEDSFCHLNTEKLAQQGTCWHQSARQSDCLAFSPLRSLPLSVTLTKRKELFYLSPSLSLSVTLSKCKKLSSLSFSLALSLSLSLSPSLSLSLSLSGCYYAPRKSADVNLIKNENIIQFKGLVTSQHPGASNSITSSIGWING